MRRLTPEERRAKFAVPPRSSNTSRAIPLSNPVGLPSRGSQGLDSAAQRQTLDTLEAHPTAERLHRLRALRESVVSSRSHSSLSRRIFETSVQELVRNDPSDPTLMPVLRYLADELEGGQHYAYLYSLVLAKRRQFHDALRISSRIDNVARAIVTSDLLEWHRLLTAERDPVARELLRAVKPQFQIPAGFHIDLTALEA